MRPWCFLCVLRAFVVNLELELLQGFLFVAANDKELVQFGNFEDFADLRIDITQDEPAAGGLDLFVQGDELAQSRTRHVLHIAEVQ